jgi:hypothetical protein
VNISTPSGYRWGVHSNGCEDGRAGTGTTWKSLSWKGFWGTMLWSSTGGEGLEIAIEVRFLPILFLPCCECVPLWGNACFTLGNGSYEINLYRRPCDESGYGRVMGTWVVCSTNDEH